MVLRHHDNEPTGSDHIDNPVIKLIVLGGHQTLRVFVLNTNRYS